MMTIGLISAYALACVVVGIPVHAYYKKVNVYESFVEGAAESFDISLKLFPYLLGMIVAVGMLRDSGAIDLLTQLLAPLFEFFGYPKALLPLSLIRPFSGAASNALFFDLIATFGPDHWIALTAATMMAATETTFYVVAVYFGSVNITRTRYAIACCLLGEFAGMIAAVMIGRYCFT